MSVGRGEPATDGSNVPASVKTVDASPQGELEQSSDDQESSPATAGPKTADPVTTDSMKAESKPTKPVEIDTAQGGAAVPDAVPTHSVQAEAKWTTERILLLAEGGPRMIELRVNVAGLDLTSGLATATETLARELNIDWNAPPTWETLLDMPLVKSGWLGNLVPTTEQRGQLLALYDTDGNGLVADEEFRAFITRGISRNPPLRVVKGRAPPRLTRSSSAWGPLDQNFDNDLSESELQKAAEVMQRFDYDGDRIVTQAEVQSADDLLSANQMARNRSLLESNKFLTIDAQKPASAVNAIFENYTFTETIPRDTFSQWKPEQLEAIDVDSDGQITKRELNKLLLQEPEVVLTFAYPSSIQENSPPAAVSPLQHATPSEWTAGTAGGQLRQPDCILTIAVRDDHDSSRRRAVEQLLTSAVDNAQLQSMLINQLELKDGAFDLLSSHGDKAAEVAWRWTVAPRDWHVTATWTVLEEPWFDLLDANADQRIVESEITQFAMAALKWDRNSNAVVEESEIPLTVALNVVRDDRRNTFAGSGGMTLEKRGANALPAPAWFSGMDYNLDGEVTRAEFLGDDSDFSALDTDSNGILGVREVYTPH